MPQASELLDLCEECNRPWKILSTLEQGEAEVIVNCMAAHDCEGIGVIRLYEHIAGELHPYWEVTTEEGVGI